ncbi:hypothetical protein [Saccharopolyspora sp. NPDC049426]|uniref:hypothetical protein n=1 Tax=Saccharopolyspora sp. NPDC049426 TaxID=3155652 RepID=UPI00343DBB6A
MKLSPGGSNSDPNGHCQRLDRAGRNGFSLVEGQVAGETVDDCRIVERSTRPFNRQGTPVTISTATSIEV